MTVAALRYYPSRDSQPTLKAVSSPPGVVASNPAKCQSQKLIPRRSHGMRAALIVSLAIHGWAISSVPAPDLPSLPASAATVSLTIGQLALTAGQPQPEEPLAEVVPELAAVSATPSVEPADSSREKLVEARSGQRRLIERARIETDPPLPMVTDVAASSAEKPVFQGNDPDSVVMPRPVDDMDVASATPPAIDPPLASTDEPLVEVSGLSNTAETDQVTPPLPVRMSNPEYRLPPQPPVYPRRAVRFGQEGTVWIQATLSEQGDVVDVEVQHSSGFPLLDKAALKAVRQWSFKPATREGRKTAAMVELPVHFQLQP